MFNYKLLNIYEHDTLTHNDHPQGIADHFWMTGIVKSVIPILHGLFLMIGIVKSVNLIHYEYVTLDTTTW